MSVFLCLALSTCILSLNLAIALRLSGQPVTQCHKEISVDREGEKPKGMGSLGDCTCKLLTSSVALTACMLQRSASTAAEAAAARSGTAARRAKGHADSMSLG
eukprot:m.480629 g.480629  ORF g.480629 m.480629 type:complete len:103 (+) comp57177_c0_seq5:1040-1348(+)